MLANINSSRKAWNISSNLKKSDIQKENAKTGPTGSLKKLDSFRSTVVFEILTVETFKN